MGNAAPRTELENQGRSFLFGLREDLGEVLEREGEVVMRPNTDRLGDVTVRVATNDTGNTHGTEAVIELPGEREMARLAISTVEPTIAAKRADTTIEPSTSVEIDGRPTDNLEPAQALREVEAAYDKGDVRDFALTG